MYIQLIFHQEVSYACGQCFQIELFNVEWPIFTYGKVVSVTVYFFNIHTARADISLSWL